MPSKDRHNRAIHEAAHVVISRKLGLGVPFVTIKTNDPRVKSESAAYASRESGEVAAQIAAYEKDAIVALAGLAANRREYGAAADLRHF